jgi:hypothetical protein
VFIAAAAAAAGRCDRSSRTYARISIIACLERLSGETRIKVSRSGEE